VIDQNLNIAVGSRSRHCLITRLLTVGNEHVVIPNSKVLAASVTNDSAHGKSGGFALGITATIRYERYELRTWTKNAEEIFDTCTSLRLNFLDAFADAGIEIITPAILSLRDASELAVPTERFPSVPSRKA
jgi:small-conductance mechanosensitive channel